MAQPPRGRGRGRASGHGASREMQGERVMPSTSGYGARGIARGFARGGPGTSYRARGDESSGFVDVPRSYAKPQSSREGDEGGKVRMKGSGKGDGQSVGRGGVRGKDKFHEVIRTRPEMCHTKKGVTGKEVMLHSNYFQIETMANWVIFQYRVDFNVEEERESLKRKWLGEHVDKIGRAYIFDGAALFTPRRLTQDNKPLSLVSCRESDNFPVQIDIRLVQELNYGSIIYLQVFNILLRRSLSHLKLQLVNRNYFDASAAIKLPHFNIEVWPGYITSIKQNETSILMCSAITHKVMRLDSALDMLGECSRQHRNFREVFQQAMVGQVILTDYNNKTYRIDDVDFSANPTSTFKLKNGENISYLEYYETRYKIRIRDLSQPLLVSRSSPRSIRGGMPLYCLLIPELCRMTGLSETMLESNEVRRGLSEYTRIEPGERIQRLKKFNERLLETKEIVDEFKRWDMALGRDLLSVPGRELPPEVIVGGSGLKYNGGAETDWTRELRSKPMLKNGTIRDWAVIVPSRMRSEVMPFLDTLKKAAGGMNFRIPQPRIYETQGDKPANLVEAVEDIIARAKMDLIMFACPNNRSDRYNAIKKKCCVDRGIPSQVVLGRSLRGRGMSIATKIAIQMNCKVGGAPWTVEVPMQSVMVVGYDACHDSYNKGKSYGAMVASLNNTLSSWFSAVSHHASGEELSDTLSLDICKALRKFQDLNHTLPSRIFVYRDGVGEGQIPYVYQHEVAILKQRLTEVYGGDSWKLCYIIVSKRINTRLFKGNKNPMAGTVVDDVITLPERFDFFLVSQTVNSGTVTPTNYNVISDNSGLKPDQIQRWTYKMTHLYYNWSGTVRVPAPCQYAHKLAFLVSQALHIQPHYYLETTLHFL